LPSASASAPRLWNLAERRTDDDVTRDGGGERGGWDDATPERTTRCGTKRANGVKNE
jgi:hypothetical protein